MTRKGTTLWPQQTGIPVRVRLTNVGDPALADRVYAEIGGQIAQFLHVCRSRLALSTVDVLTLRREIPEARMRYLAHHGTEMLWVEVNPEAVAPRENVPNVQLKILELDDWSLAGLSTAIVHPDTALTGSAEVNTITIMPANPIRAFRASKVPEEKFGLMYYNTTNGYLNTYRGTITDYAQEPYYSAMLWDVKHLAELFRQAGVPTDIIELRAAAWWYNVGYSTVATGEYYVGAYYLESNFPCPPGQRLYYFHTDVSPNPYTSTFPDTQAEAYADYAAAKAGFESDPSFCGWAEDTIVYQYERTESRHAAASATMTAQLEVTTEVLDPVWAETDQNLSYTPAHAPTRDYMVRENFQLSPAVVLEDDTPIYTNRSIVLSGGDTQYRHYQILVDTKSGAATMRSALSAYDLSEITTFGGSQSDPFRL